ETALVPGGRREVVTAARPWEASVSVPSCVVPSANVTVPVGVAPPEGGTTSAVRVSGWPYDPGFPEELSPTVAVTCAAWTTQCGRERTADAATMAAASARAQREPRGCGECMRPCRAVPEVADATGHRPGGQRRPSEGMC